MVPRREADELIVSFSLEFRIILLKKADNFQSICDALQSLIDFALDSAVTECTPEEEYRFFA